MEILYAPANPDSELFHAPAARAGGRFRRVGAFVRGRVPHLNVCLTHLMVTLRNVGRKIPGGVLVFKGFEKTDKNTF